MVYIFHFYDYKVIYYSYIGYSVIVLYSSILLTNNKINYIARASTRAFFQINFNNRAKTEGAVSL